MGAVEPSPEVQAWVYARIAESEARVHEAIVAAGRLFAAKAPKVAGTQAPTGTVVGAVGLAVQVDLDDGTGVIASTATAPVSVGDRVAVLVVPPAGSFVLGPIG